MKLHIRNIALVFALLLLGGIANEAWADVTYIILTKPFDVRNAANNDNYWTNIRLEALRCTSSGTTVYLPDEFRSPLATNFQYWKTPTVTANTRLYQTNGTTPDVLSTTYDIYNETLTGKMTENSTLASNGNPSVIYVTYDYNASNTILQLDGTQKYNVTLNTGNNLRFFAYNKNRGNRPAAAKGTTVSAEDLVSSVFTPNVGGFDGTKEAYYQFIFSGLDPYNITIGTAYSGNETYSEKLEVEGTAYKKPYAGGTIFAKLQSKNNNDGTANMWLSSDAHRHYKSTTDATSYDSWEGFYRSNMNPIFNAVALLPKGTSYFFVATKLNQNNTIYQPNNSGNYATLSDDGKNPRMIFKALSSAVQVEPYPIYTYKFMVKTPFDDHYVDDDLEWSDYYKTTTLSSKFPESLKRKYTTITGFYADAELTNAVTTFADVQSKCGKDVDGKYLIFVDYSVTSLPFETLPVGGSYANARWYQMTDKDSSGKKIKWDSSSSSFKNNGDADDYALETHFAFIGDPYELHVINRKLSEDNTANHYVGSSSQTTETALTHDASYAGAGYKWEIPNDAVSGNFTLREFKNDNAYWNWNTTEGSTVQYTTTDDSPIRIKVLELPKVNYVYHIVRDDAGTIAVKATASQDRGSALKVSNIPEIIRSPFIGLSGATVKFYWSLDDAKGNDNVNAKTNAPLTISSESDKNIYVRYNISSISNDYKKFIDGTTEVNVRLNGQYLYYDSSDGSIKSSDEIVDSDSDGETNDETKYQWKLGGTDPYTMTIRNNEAAMYVTANATDGAALGWDVDLADATKFIIKSGNNLGVYEVMLATGTSDDASTTYYNIGRDGDGTKIFKNTTYPHGYDQLRFQLTPLDAHNVKYHLIDKEGKDLLQVDARHTGTEAPLFPNEYRSPLVAQYHYYILARFTDPNTSTTPVSGNANARYNLTTDTPLETIGDVTDVYVTYDTGNSYDLQNKRTMYLLKYDMGASFRQEDGSDGLTETEVQGVYPYCNGDGNFFVYGQNEFESQQQKGASTRTRWAWFLESTHNDPYHVKICSRQIEKYNGEDTRAYFRTYAETYNGAPHVVTALSWPGISGLQGTDYMVLGSVGQFRLVTSNAVNDGNTNVRRTVNSFEQYWKTWNTVRKVVLGDEDAEAKQSDPNIVPATPATTVATNAGKNNRTYLTEVMGWHCYAQWAYAVRWNGYNKAGKKGSKGWEDLEHWFQTVSMGEGYFDLVPVTIDPVLILLDKHGWEIMRKPLPTDPNDPEKEDKYNQIRPYDSPMVKEYHFWGSASKRSGFHQYYNLGGRMEVDGEPFVSTSLTTLPDYYNSDGTRNTTIVDNKGNQLDEYVTYVVKDEYAQGLGDPFMIEQGSHFASATNATTLKNNNVATNGMPQYIIDNAANLTAEGSKNSELWYLKPNPDIDIEMGYQDATKFPDGYAHDWTNDYPTEDDFSESGFDPYNIQISNVEYTAGYFVTNATTAQIQEGSTVGNGTTNILGTQAELHPTLSGGMDNRTLQVTNATFMAVQDDEGHMQLMPRFDQNKRLKDFTTLTTASDNGTHTKLYRPLVYDYRIIDNDGNESLRYQGGGDLVPQTPEWFKSQLAKDYKYYAGISGSTGQNEITGSLKGATLTNDIVYVRYSYDEDADVDKVLQGKWLTMTLNAKNAVYSDGLKQASGAKPTSVNGDAKQWQWKFLATPQSTPDPYAVSLYNRNVGGAATSVNEKTKFALLNYYNDGVVDPNIYTLAVAGLGTTNYQFVNGADMTTSVAATTATETNFKSTSCSYDGTKAQVVLTDDVEHTFTYKIYTNGTNGSNEVKYGVFAVSADQDNATVVDNGYVPTLPYEIKSPLLNYDQFMYYGAEADMGNSAKELTHLYGLYDDIVYVRYTAYNDKTTEYKVPNVKTTVDSKVARDAASNDAALDISSKLIYNIIWYDDKMMESNGTSISDGGSETLSGNAEHVWQFAGNDPYAIQIKHKNSTKYAVGTGSLADTPTSTFMLLPASDSWPYGELQLTGGTNKLSGYGQETVASNPTRFIIFGLSTHKVIYHLVIANINGSERIPYYNGSSLEESHAIAGSTHRDLTTGSGATYQLGSTIDGLNYCVDDGHITLGDPLKVPDALKRPNCKYFYYVGNIQTAGDAATYKKTATNASHMNSQVAGLGTVGYYYFRIGSEPYTYKRVQVTAVSPSVESNTVDCTEDDYNNAWQDNGTLNDKYKGHELPQMGTEPELLGTKVLINIVYAFNDGLTTNNGSHFVTNTSGTQWYTFETNDATPYLANFTYKDNKMRGVPGRVGHYTNEFLWSPVGDPYGFKMYNRYVYKNGNETTKVMTTTLNPAADADLIMAVDASLSKPVYELLPGYTDGYFKVQTLTVPGSGTPYYIDNTSGTIKLKTSTTTEWTYGLSESLFDPYYLGAGNVGGLDTTKVTKSNFKAMTLQQKQAVAYTNDDANVVAFTPGYYRIFNQPNSQGITVPRFLSGYTHKTELTGDGSQTNSAIPMHFYERSGVTTSFDVLGSGFTKSAPTQGQIPIEAPEYDPASIFQFTGTTSAATMSTQGLYVKENKMTATSGEATSFEVVDIGGAVVLLRNGSNYLHYKQTGNIYDVKFETASTFVDDDAAKWCMEPANKKGLWIATHSGGEEAVLTDLWYYSSYCVPFDLMVSNKNDDPEHSSNAYTCVASESPWSVNGLHPRPIGKYTNADGASYPTFLCKRTDPEKGEVNNDYFVPAGTPVLFSTKRATQYIRATIPTTTPSTPITTIFSAKYLEQLLTPYDNTKRVYVFGPKMEGEFTINTSTGAITAALPSTGNTNVGFHINANLNKETGMTTTSWTRNNYYVLHNRIYYKSDTDGASAPSRRAIEFVPVIFDDEEGDDQEISDKKEQVFDGRVYNLQGRCVATEEQVKDGTWRDGLEPGIYIVNGKKLVITRK